MKRNIIIPALALGIALPCGMVSRAERVWHIDMESDATGMITERVTSGKILVFGQHGAENIAGAAGDALRLDGYSTYATGNVTPGGASAKDEATFSLWVAPETYPIIRHDEPTGEKIILAGTLNEGAKKGWAFMLGSTGKYSFVCYSGGWKVEVEAEDALPHYEWSRLAAVVDGSAITLYRNGEKVKEARSLGPVDDSSATLYIGKSPADSRIDVFNINTFNGLIDDLEVYDEALDASSLKADAEHPADLAVPKARFSTDLLRPRIHGMPAANWTNESHGMTYADGKYHVFFQKNANGPYMSRLHWGHISSPDLINWTEEKIALFPDTDYDVKGCWSGCVFADDVITGGAPNIIYTGVDYAKAYIAQAAPADEGLIEWEKKDGNPIINGRPAGLSDDFRDPYFFRNGDNAYIIVGTSKDGIGAVTLHRYVPLSGTWTNAAGDIFFAGTDKASCGTFWEMPNVTPMGDGKWLFTATPQNTSNGVRTLYWTGSINADGTFSPDAASSKPRLVELMSKDGYGLLSPTIYRKDGKTIALGIVPDKLPGATNFSLGWAHCYSLPREWSLDSQGNLLQKPFEGLSEARIQDNFFAENDITLDGSKDLAPACGRQVEVLGRFTVGSAPFGFRFFKNGASQATLKYIPSTNMLMVDLTQLDRMTNDNGSYNGTYSCVLPEALPQGSEMKINVFVDGSILDIFVNDKWATSIRVFPKGSDANHVEAFAEGAVQVKELKAWNLDFDTTDFVGVGAVDTPLATPEGKVNVVDLQGRVLKRGVAAAEAADSLAPGIYIIGGKKFIVR